MIQYEDLLGIPFAWGGRTLQELDCYGLVKVCFERKGVELPEYPSSMDTMENTQTIKTAESRDWVKSIRAQPGMAVALRLMSHEVNHVGFMIDQVRFLHTTISSGVVVERIDSPKWRHRLVGFYDWQPIESRIEVIDPLPNTIRVTKIKNPFDHSQRETRVMDMVKGKDLTYYLQEDEYKEESLVLSVNGKILKKNEIELTIPNRTLSVVIMPRIQHGVLRTVAMIGVMVLAAYATGIGPIAFHHLIGHIIAAGITFTGALLINFLLPPVKKENTKQNQIYAWSGPQLTARQGIAIPKGYGKLRVSGNLIGSYVQTIGEKQYMNLLISFGHGPIRDVTDVEINGNKAGNYLGVVLEKRLGLLDQSVVSYFGNLVTEVPFGTEIRDTEQFQMDGFPDDLIDALEITMSFPRGVWQQNDKGEFKNYLINYRIEYAAHGSGVWKPILRPRTRAPFPPYTNLVEELPPGGTYIKIVPGTFVPFDAIPFPAMLGSEQVTVVGFTTDSITIDRQPANLGITHYIGERITEIILDTSLLVISSTGISAGPAPVAVVPNEGEDVLGTTSLVTVNAPVYDEDEAFVGTQSFQTEVVRVSSLSDPATESGAPGAQVETWSTVTESVNSNNTDAFYRVTLIDHLTPGSYDVRITRLTKNVSNVKVADTMVLTSIKKITYDKLSYPGIAMLAVRALATDQISGNLNVTAVVDYGDPDMEVLGFPEVQGYTGDNPAIAAWDIMVNKEYGGGIDPTLLDKVSWKEWADYNNELVTDGSGGQIFRHIFNGTFENPGNVWDAIGQIGAMSRAVVVRNGMKYRVILDKIGLPVQIFSSSNIVMDSLSHIWMGLNDRANSVDLTFLNEQANYKKLTLTVEDDEVIAASQSVKKAPTIDLFGVTNPAEVWRHGKYLTLVNKYLKETVQFDADVDAIVAEIGDIIRVQHETPNWGLSGRITEIRGPNAVTIDRLVDMQPGKIYELLIRSAATDKIQILDVDNTGTVTDLISTTEVFTNFISVDDMYIFGELDQAKAFRIIKIAKKGDLKRTITALEYDERVYTDLDPSLNNPPIDVDAAVKDLKANQYRDVDGNRWVGIGWSPGKTTVGATVYVSVRPAQPPVPGNTTGGTAPGEAIVSTWTTVGGFITGLDAIQSFVDKSAKDEDLEASLDVPFFVNKPTRFLDPNLANRQSFNEIIESPFSPEIQLAVVPRVPFYPAKATNVGDTWIIRVVGFDVDGRNAPYRTAPTLKIVIGEGELLLSPYAFKLDTNFQGDLNVTFPVGVMFFGWATTVGDVITLQDPIPWPPLPTIEDRIWGRSWDVYHQNDVFKVSEKNSLDTWVGKTVTYKSVQYQILDVMSDHTMRVNADLGVNTGWERITVTEIGTNWKRGRLSMSYIDCVKPIFTELAAPVASADMAIDVVDATNFEDGDVIYISTEAMKIKSGATGVTGPSTFELVAVETGSQAGTRHIDGGLRAGYSGDYEPGDEENLVFKAQFKTVEFPIPEGLTVLSPTWDLYDPAQFFKATVKVGPIRVMIANLIMLDSFDSPTSQYVGVACRVGEFERGIADEQVTNEKDEEGERLDGSFPGLRSYEGSYALFTVPESLDYGFNGLLPIRLQDHCVGPVFATVENAPDDATVRLQVQIDGVDWGPFVDIEIAELTSGLVFSGTNFFNSDSRPISFIVSQLPSVPIIGFKLHLVV